MTRRDTGFTRADAENDSLRSRRRQVLSRLATWLRKEYLPVVRMLHQADLVGADTEADAYLWVACERYRLIRTHDWDEEVITRIRNAR